MGRSIFTESLLPLFPPIRPRFVPDSFPIRVVIRQRRVVLAERARMAFVGAALLLTALNTIFDGVHNKLPPLVFNCRFGFVVFSIMTAG